MKICKFCSNSCHPICYTADPIPEIPEIKKTIYFCSQECMYKFVKKIKSVREKTTKLATRSSLEKANRTIKDNDTTAIFNTLTQKEIRHLAAVGLGTILGECNGNIACFYRRLSDLIEKNDNKKHLDFRQR